MQFVELMVVLLLYVLVRVRLFVVFYFTIKKITILANVYCVSEENRKETDFLSKGFYGLVNSRFFMTFNVTSGYPNKRKTFTLKYSNKTYCKTMNINFT